MGSKKFWSTVKPFFSSKGFIHNNDITIEIDNKIIEDESELAKTFHLHYIDIVQWNLPIADIPNSEHALNSGENI